MIEKLEKGMTNIMQRIHVKNDNIEVVFLAGLCYAPVPEQIEAEQYGYTTRLAIKQGKFIRYSLSFQRRGEGELLVHDMIKEGEEFPDFPNRLFP